jgi:tetraprenyl-beta-curcumene synthase
VSASPTARRVAGGAAEASEPTFPGVSLPWEDGVGSSTRQAWPATAFIRTLSAYLTTVLPSVERQLAGWRSHADRIPDPTLRRLALDALGKRGNMRGAALLAVLSPGASRAATTRALVSFQCAYNYLDILAEQPSADPVGNGRRLHAALLAALDTSAPCLDWYESNDRREDGYLVGMVEACRAAVGALPSYGLVRNPLLESAARIVDFQALNLGEAQGSCELLERWGSKHTPPASGLAWWETAAAGGSSLGVHALVGLAARPELGLAEVATVERGYFPWIGALHSLLDSAVDVAEDRREGQRNLLGHYSSIEHAQSRIRLLAEVATSQARALGSQHRHEVILSAMIGYYLSALPASDPAMRGLAREVISAAGPMSGVALRLLGTARPFSHLVNR